MSEAVEKANGWHPRTSKELIAEAREKLEQDFPYASAATIAALPMEGKSLEQQAAQRALARELGVIREQKLTVEKLRQAYGDWEVAGFPAERVMHLTGISIGLKVNG